MKSLMLLWRDVAQDMGDRCAASTTRDFQTVTRRIEHEGISFLTICLPDFGRDFDEALDQGKVGHTHFAGFRRRGGTPRFLGGFLDLVFDRMTGVLLLDPSTAAIQAVRQLTRLFSKVSLKCSFAREKAAYDEYIRTDAELEEVEETWSETQVADFKRIANLAFGRTLAIMDNLHNNGLLVPKHGPGATAD